MQKYVCGLLFSPDREQVVLIQKLNPAWQRGKFNGVGGHVEPGETAIAAMSRECLEETGVQIEHAAWQPLVHMLQPNVYELDFFFAWSEGALSARTMEAEPVALFPVANLPANLLPNLRWLIPLALDQGIQFSAPMAIELKDSE